LRQSEQRQVALANRSSQAKAAVELLVRVRTRLRLAFHGIVVFGEEERAPRT